LSLHKIVAVLTTCLFSLLLGMRLVWLAPRGFESLKRRGVTSGLIASADHALRTALPVLYEPPLPTAAIALYLFLSLVAVALLGLTGYLGGALVYDHGVTLPGAFISTLL
ncbi:MAG TPA: DUF2231 domain-containing protein, partial [Ktedonobacterales bacterium]